MSNMLRGSILLRLSLLFLGETPAAPRARFARAFFAFVLPGGSSPRPPFSRFARRAVTGVKHFFQLPATYYCWWGFLRVLIFSCSLLLVLVKLVSQLVVYSLVTTILIAPYLSHGISRANKSSNKGEEGSSEASPGHILLSLMIIT
jgi:hypothetical protein